MRRESSAARAHAGVYSLKNVQKQLPERARRRAVTCGDGGHEQLTVRQRYVAAEGSARQHQRQQVEKRGLHGGQQFR